LDDYRFEKQDKEQLNIKYEAGRSDSRGVSGGQSKVLGDGGVHLQLHVLLDFSILATSIEEDDQDVEDDQEDDDHNEDTAGDTTS
jgi:hypothetical protein